MAPEEYDTVRKCRFVWNHKSEIAMLEVWQKFGRKVRTQKRNIGIYKQMRNAMIAKGYAVDTEIVRNKLHNFGSRFRKEEIRKGDGESSWWCYNWVQDIMCDKPKKATFMPNSDESVDQSMLSDQLNGDETNDSPNEVNFATVAEPDLLISKAEENALSADLNSSKSEQCDQIGNTFTGRKNKNSTNSQLISDDLLCDIDEDALLSSHSFEQKYHKFEKAMMKDLKKSDKRTNKKLNTLIELSKKRLQLQKIQTKAILDLNKNFQTFTENFMKRTP